MAISFRERAVKCKVADTKEWLTCWYYEPISRQNSVCTHSGCANFCNNVAMKAKPVRKI